MLLDIIKQFNWVDILVLIILFRICYVAAKNGFTIEIFKLPGTILAIYLGMHYYILLGNILHGYIGEEIIPLEFLDFISFVFLATLGYLFFLILRAAFSRFLKLEAVAVLNRWGGLILGIGRAFLLASLAIFMLYISSTDYFKESAKKSYSGAKLFKIAPSTYSFVLDNFIAKFWPKEKYNEIIPEVEQNFFSKPQEGKK